MSDESRVALIDDANAAATLRMVNELYNDPATRGKLQEVIKQKFPQATIPEFDAVKAVEPRLAEMQKSLTEERAERQKDKNERAWRDHLAGLQADTALRMRPDEEAALIDTMKQEHIGSPRAALELMRSREQHTGAPTPIDYDPSMRIPGYKGAGGDEFKGLWEDRTNWFRKKVSAIRNEFATNSAEAQRKYANG